MARDEFYRSPFYLKVATLEPRLKQSQPFSEYDLLIMCMYGVDKSFRLATELNG